MDVVKTVVLVTYFVLLTILSIYGAHRLWMLLLYYRHKNDPPQPQGDANYLPVVTVQLAVFNEVNVVERLLDAGAPPDLPVVLVEDVSGPFETITRSVLAHAAAGLLQSRTEGPGIVYLGPAAGLRIVPHAYPGTCPETSAVPRPLRLPRAAGGGRPDR